MTTRLLPFGSRHLELGGPHLGLLRESNDIRDDFPAMRARLAEDGYLLVRGLYDRDETLAARREAFAYEPRFFKPGTELAEGVINPTQPENPRWLTHGGEVTRGAAMLRLLEGPRVMRFFDRLFDEPARSFDFKWIRFMGTGAGSPAHFDNSYMGRGSARLFTVWSALTDVPLDRGPLALIPRSHSMPSYARLRETLGQMDVDRDQVRGDFFGDPLQPLEQFGGQWATGEFQAGDALIFGMFTLHASLTNTSDRYRLTTDTRFQPAADPVDERWVGEKPKAHYAWQVGPGVTMAEKKKEWGF
jgi:hypothetical protein